MCYNFCHVLSYYPLKIKYTTGEEQKKAMEDFLTLQKNILEENSGMQTAKYRYEKEQSEQKHRYETKINNQKKKNIITILASSVLGLVLLNIIFFLSRKKTKLESNNKELKLNILNTKFDAITKERNRISKELHDDLGATFTSISMATQMLKNFPEKSDKYLQVISNNSNRMSEKVNEIVWSLNSRNDNLGSLSAYIINFAKKFFEPTSIHLNIETDKTIEENHEKFVAADKRRMIFLTAKEILNNIMKHADAKNVVMKLILDGENKFSIKIKDDGKGIELPENHSGNGLKNIAENIGNIKGECSYETSDNGTEFLISVKI